MKSARLCMLLFALFFSAAALRAQGPVGPITPQPGVAIQQAPPAAPQLKSRVTLVNTPVTVRNGKGEMVHDLQPKDFRVTDNGAAQIITHFDLGGDPISLVVLVETSSRIVPLTGEGISALTLSVAISTKGSYFSTVSPGFLSHSEIVPSVTVSPSCGIVIVVGIRIAPSPPWRRPCVPWKS